jgi:hypothetical protein
MLLAAVAQVVIALRDPRATLLGIAAIFTLALTLPVILLLTSTPPVSADKDGLTVEPLIGRPIHVAWSEIAAVKEYPLLPPRESESGRKLMVGKRRYQAAQGLLLVVPKLPAPYRVVGFFCGEGFRPCIGVTNRSHRDYERLASLIEAHTGASS